MASLENGARMADNDLNDDASDNQTQAHTPKHSAPADGREVLRGDHFAAPVEATAAAESEAESPIEAEPPAESEAVPTPDTEPEAQTEAATLEVVEETKPEATGETPQAEVQEGTEDETPEDEVVAPLPEDPSQRDPEAAKKKKGIPLAAKVLILAVVILLIVVVGAGAVYINSIDEQLALEDEEEAAALEEALVSTDEIAEAEEATEDEEEEEVIEPFYVLILGSDETSTSTSSRADVIMLVRVDLENAVFTLVSIPRDTMISGSVASIQKINAEYTNGAATMVEAVSEFAGVDISHYVEVNFEGFKDVVNALGGVWVDIPEGFTTHNGKYTFEAGEQLLTGAEALAYVRERYNVSGGDFGRAQAQRQVAEAIIEEVLDCSVSELADVIDVLAESITTDLTTAEIVSYALALYDNVDDLTFYSTICPSYSLYVDGVSYVATMYDEWRTMMQLVDAGLDPDDEDAEIPEEQLENELLGAATNAVGPTDYEALVDSAGLTTDDVVDPDEDDEEEEETDSADETVSTEESAEETTSTE